MSRIISFSMFFLSFIPLWISVIFIDVKNMLCSTENLCTEKISIIMILICFVLSFIVLITIFKGKNKNNVGTKTIISVKEHKTITSEFLLSYILPLFTFDFTLWNEVVLFIIFFITFAFICIRHNYFSVNIMLEILGYRFFDCELKNDDGINIEKVVITRDILMAKKGDNIKVRTINNDYYLQVEN